MGRLRMALLAGLAAVSQGSLAFGAPAAASAGPQAPAPICAALSREISIAEKELSSVSAEGLTDNSAPRATMRAAQMSVQMERISVNLALMRDHRCAPYPNPIQVGAYLLPAMECQTQLLKQQTAIVSGASRDTTSPPECARENWTRAVGR